MTDEIKVDRPPVCVWVIYTTRADGQKSVRFCLGNRAAEKAKALTKLEPGDSVALIKYDREDTATPRNNGGGLR